MQSIALRWLMLSLLLLVGACEGGQSESSAKVRVPVSKFKRLPQPNLIPTADEGKKSQTGLPDAIFRFYTRLPGEQKPSMIDVAVAGNGSAYVILNDRGQVNVWDEKGALLPGERFPDPGIAAVDLSPDGRLIAMALKSGEVVLRRIPSGQLAQRIAVSAKGLSHLRFQGDGLALAVARNDQKVSILRRENDEKIAVGRTFGPTRFPIDALAISRSGRYVAVAQRNGHVEIFDRSSPSKTKKRRLPRGSSSSLCFFGAKESTLIIGGSLGLFVYDLRGGGPTFVPERSAVTAVACLNDKDGILVATKDGKLRLRSYTTLEELRVLGKGFNGSAFFWQAQGQE